MVDVLAIIIFYMVGSIGFQNLYMVGLNKMCLPTPMSLSIMDDEAFLLYLIITNVIEYNG
jgi:hypothetical protein